jgi:putative transcriptional regulator
MSGVSFKCNLRLIFAEIKQNDKSFTQEKFAREVGITKGSLSALVNGHNPPTFFVEHKIAKLLNRKIEEIWEVRWPENEAGNPK